MVLAPSTASGSTRTHQGLGDRAVPHGPHGEGPWGLGPKKGGPWGLGTVEFGGGTVGSGTVEFGDGDRGPQMGARGV